MAGLSASHGRLARNRFMRDHEWCTFMCIDGIIRGSPWSAPRAAVVWLCSSVAQTSQCSSSQMSPSQPDCRSGCEK